MSGPVAGRPTRRSRLRSLGPIALLALAWVACAGLPVGGDADHSLAILDTTMTRFMERHGIGAGLLGVAKDGCIVARRSYGWSDAARTRPLPPDSLMRVASLTKPITAAAIRRLAADPSVPVSLESRVFSLGEPGRGLLDHAPFPSLGDERLRDVTVGQLLRHEGGWDPDGPQGDLTYREREVAAAMGIPSPPGADATVRFILGQPLRFTPGTRSVYSNEGYLLLGLVVERYGGGYLRYVRERVLPESLGIRPGDVALGRTLEADRHPREAWYASDRTRPSVFPPHAPVPEAYGSWHHEARVGQGAVVASLTPLLVLLRHYVVEGESIGAPIGGRPHATRSHSGGFEAGTEALATQRDDGVDYVVVFNRRSRGASFARAIAAELDAIFDAPPFAWPPACGAAPLDSVPPASGR